MTVIVRDLRPEDPSDTEACARARHAAMPYLVCTAASLAYDVLHAHPDGHFRMVVAEEDAGHHPGPQGTGKEIIGMAAVQVAYDSPEPGIGNANIYIHPDRRGRGAGSLLLRTAQEHLAAHGVRKVFSWVLDEPAGLAFARKRGYRARRPGRFLRLDLTGGALPPLPVLPAGVELRAGADFADDPRPLFDLDAQTILDEPSDVDMEFTQYEQWLADTWQHPLTSPELSMVVLVDGRPAAFTLARTDGGTRYGTLMTGTARAFRGRGLARLCKSAALHRARTAGCTEALTSNDADNTAMLAVNKWCGYEIAATEIRHVHELA